MTLSPEIQDSIKIYLWEVASYLHVASPTSRTEILHDVESHIHEALFARNAEPTSEDLHAILADMPKPSSYATESLERPVDNRTSDTVVKAGESFSEWVKRFTWQSIVGPLLLLIGCPLLIEGLKLLTFQAFFAWTTHIVYLQEFGDDGIIRIIGSILLFIGIVALIAAREIGRGGVDRIRESNWKLYGFFGAYIAYIVPELLLITIVVGGLLAIILTAADCPILLTAPVVLVVLGTIYYFVIKYTWIRLNRQNDTLTGVQS